MASDTLFPTADLTPRLQELLEQFPGQDQDVSVTTLYEKFMGHASPHNVRWTQQYMGSYFTKLNRRIKKNRLRVVPGRLKETYRLVSTR